MIQNSPSRNYSLLALLAAFFTAISPLQAEIVCGKVAIRRGVPKLAIRRLDAVSCPAGFRLILNTADILSGATAGGVLNGTYPNPGLAAAAVGPLNLDTLPGMRISRMGSAQTLTNGVQTPVVFNTEAYDDLGFYPGTGDVVTIPLSGTYLATAEVCFAISATGIRNVTIQKNGSTVLVSQLGQGTANGNQISVATVARLAAGDQLQVKAFQNSGGNLDTFASGVGNAYLALQWIAP